MTIESLKQFGADTADGLKRCMNMEDFYLDLVQTALEDTSQVEALERALKAHDFNTPFEMAHALKGIYANLALTPLTKPVSEMTELLRSRTEMDYEPLMNEIRHTLDELQKLA